MEGQLEQEAVTLSRRLSKLRFTRDFLDIQDFTSDTFKSSDVIEKLLEIGGVSEDVRRTGKDGSSVEKTAETLFSACSAYVALVLVIGAVCGGVYHMFWCECRLDARLDELEEDVEQQCEHLRVQLSTDHAGYASRISQTEKQLQRLEESLDRLEKRSDELVSFGRNVGTPFVDIQHQKERAMEMADILDHLTIFSHCTDVSNLPSIFHDDDTIEKCANIVCLLMSAIESVVHAQSSSRGGDQPLMMGRNMPGTIGAAWEQLVLYLNLLDNKIVSHFDSAAESRNIAAMAYYSRIMEKAHSHTSGSASVLMSRYISRRSIFISSDSLFEKLDLNFSTEQSSDFKVHGLDSQSHVEASRRVTYACRHVSENLHEECSVLEQVFEDPEKAISMFVTRIFEETLSETIGRAFELAGYGEEDTTAKLRDSLRLTCVSYRKICSLADEACHLIPHPEENGLSVHELAEAAMGSFLAEYPGQEKQWHQLLGLKTIQASKEDLSNDIVLNLISINEESLKRCKQVIPENRMARFVEELFLSKNMSQSDDGGAALLDYVGTYLMETLQRVEGKALKQMEAHGIWRDVSIHEKAIDASIDASFGAVARSASTAAEIHRSLVGHYDKELASYFSVDRKEPRLALFGLQRGVEDHIAIILESCLRRLMEKTADLLYACQYKSDFLIDGSNTSEIERPTATCLKVCAIFNTVIQTVKMFLRGNNYSSFMHALTEQLEKTIEKHLLKFYYTPGGALRMKRDLTAYAECIAPSGTKKAFDDLIAISNVLIVGPSSVHEMAELVSYLDRDRVNQFIKRRAHK